MFDLFRLHDQREDIFPESWIGFEGNKLHEITERIVSDINSADKKSSYYAICKKISIDTNLCINAVWNYLKNKNYILIPVLKALIDIWATKLNKQSRDVGKIKKEILLNVQYLRVNNSSSVKIKPLRYLTEELAFFAGAHAADGMINVHVTFSHEKKDNLKHFKLNMEKSLNQEFKSNIYFDKHKQLYNFGFSLSDSLNTILLPFLLNNEKIMQREIRLKREFRWKLAEGYFLPVKRVKKCINNLFCLQLKIKKDKTNNAFILETKNKILVRYLCLFFDYPTGKKSRIVDEPLVLKTAPMKYRVAFLRAVFTFDGGVNRDGTVALETYSKYIFHALLDILSKNSILFLNYKTKRGSFCIQNRSHLKKWLIVFEEGTEKWCKLNSFVSERNLVHVDSEDHFIKRISEIYPNSGMSKINLITILNIAKALNTFDIKSFATHLKEKFEIELTEWRILKNLEILIICNVLIQNKEKKFFVRHKGKMKGTKGVVMKNIFTFNGNFTKWRLPY